MIKECNNCNTEFDSNKDNQRYCSNACKTSASRKRNINNLSDNNSMSMFPITQNVGMNLINHTTHSLGNNLSRQIMPKSTMEGFPVEPVSAILCGLLGTYIHYSLNHKHKKYSIIDSLNTGGLYAIGGYAISSVAMKVYDYYQPQIDSYFAPLQLPNGLSDSGRTLSANQLLNTNSRTIRLGGVWDDFIGESPNFGFNMIVFGMPGSGKSHFSMRFANTLSQLGNVLYVLTEEDGTQNHVQERIRKWNLTTNVEYLNTTKSTDIIDQLKTGKFNFVVIDSLSGLHDLHFSNHAQFISQMRGYNLTGLVNLLQVNKDGTASGKNNVIHECDIQIEVEKGIATIRKNRFGTFDKTLEIFKDNSSNVFNISNTQRAM
jgi:hypothetical protein